MLKVYDEKMVPLYNEDKRVVHSFALFYGIRLLPELFLIKSYILYIFKLFILKLHILLKDMIL